VNGQLAKGHKSRRGSTQIGYYYLEFHASERELRFMLQSMRKNTELKQFSLVTRLHT
jgi:hypothetical protein